MAQYKTHQKAMLEKFLTEQPDRQFSIEELASLMKEHFKEEAPGKSTVYRLINKLVEENTVKRFVKDNSRHFVYQIAAGKDCHSHLHMKCVDCGRLIHMDHEQSDAITEAIFGHDSFRVNRDQTTIFGTCAECIKKTV